MSNTSVNALDEQVRETYTTFSGTNHERVRCARLLDDAAQSYSKMSGSSTLTVSELISILDSLRISIVAGEEPVVEWDNRERW